MALNIENTNGAPLDINDLGITLDTGEIADLALRSDALTIAGSANGGDLETLNAAADINVKDPVDGTTSLSIADGLTAMRAMNETHWRVGAGARIGDISDVDVTGLADNFILEFDSGSGTWLATVNTGGTGISRAVSDVIADSGSFASVGEDTFNIIGGTNITTTIVGDTITIDASAGADQNLWETITSDSGSAVANITTDTLSILGGLGIDTSITGDILTITLNAVIDDLTDVDTTTTTPVAESHLVFDGVSSNWEPQAPDQATAFGQMFEIVFSSESSVKEAWIFSSGSPSNEAPPVCGWDCRLAGITFTNKEVNVDTVVEIYRTAELAAPATRTLVATWSILNARTARKTDYTASGGGNFVQFFEGDKISVFFAEHPSGDNDPSGVTLILHFIVTNFTGDEVLDNWSGDIPDP